MGSRSCDERGRTQGTNTTANHKHEQTIAEQKNLCRITSCKLSNDINSPIAFVVNHHQFKSCVSTESWFDSGFCYRSSARRTDRQSPQSEPKCLIDENERQTTRRKKKQDNTYSDTNTPTIDARSLAFGHCSHSINHDDRDFQFSILEQYRWLVQCW